MQADTIDALPYLDAVVRETLRVVPPVHGTGRIFQTVTMMTSQFIPSARGYYQRLDPNLAPRRPPQWQNHS